MAHYKGYTNQLKATFGWESAGTVPCSESVARMGLKVAVNLHHVSQLALHI